MWIERRLSRRNRSDAAHTGASLYARAVAAARVPIFYQVGDQQDDAGGFGVPDTLDGRFDMICLMVALLVRRLRHTAPGVAQALFDAMFRDMDASLRELGVGDLGVPRRVAAMWQAFNGRCQAYDTALEGGSLHELSGRLACNIWRGSVASGTADRLARHVAALDRSLWLHPDAALLDGTVALAAPVAQAASG
nr:ubiquinol-cytochrome C chaperone family protein [uncultured Lichenicoccus sp.]